MLKEKRIMFFLLVSHDLLYIHDLVRVLGESEAHSRAKSNHVSSIVWIEIHRKRGKFSEMFSISIAFVCFFFFYSLYKYLILTEAFLLCWCQPSFAIIYSIHSWSDFFPPSVLHSVLFLLKWHTKWISFFFPWNLTSVFVSRWHFVFHVTTWQSYILLQLFFYSLFHVLFFFRWLGMEFLFGDNLFACFNNAFSALAHPNLGLHIANQMC